MSYTYSLYRVQNGTQKLCRNDSKCKILKEIWYSSNFRYVARLTRSVHAVHPSAPFPLFMFLAHKLKFCCFILYVFVLWYIWARLFRETHGRRPHEGVILAKYVRVSGIQIWPTHMNGIPYGFFMYAMNACHHRHHHLQQYHLWSVVTALCLRLIH